MAGISEVRGIGDIHNGLSDERLPSDRVSEHIQNEQLQEEIGFDLGRMTLADLLRMRRLQRTLLGLEPSMLDDDDLEDDGVED